MISDAVPAGDDRRDRLSPTSKTGTNIDADIIIMDYQQDGFKAEGPGTETRPVALPVITENIPVELKARAQWVLWKYEFREGKWTKPPRAVSGALASSTEPATWATFEAAIETYRAGGWDGIGYVHLPSDNLIGGDADKCRDPITGTVEGDDAAALLELDTYTEVSPSGTGLRAYAFGKKPGRRCKRGGFEMYDGTTSKGEDGGRFLTLTGHRLPDSPATINERQEIIARIYERYWPPKQPTGTGQRGPTATPCASDDEILQRAFANSKNGAKIKALFGGDTSGYKSASEADLALANYLAFWFNRDPDAIERVFARSGLAERAKWKERADYRKVTIASAIEGATEGYDPARRRATRGPGNDTCGGHDSKSDVTYPKPRSGELWTDPHRLARLFVDDRLTDASEPTVLQWREEWHRWENGAWRVWPDSDLDAVVMTHCRQVFEADLPQRIAEAEWIAEQSDSDKEPKLPTLPVVTTRVRADVKANLAGLINLADVGTDPPFWIAGADQPDPTEVIAAPNGLFLIRDIAQGNAPFAPPTPRFFTPNALSFQVALGEQPPPSVWTRCLEQWFSGDARSILGLQEWLGYLLSADTSLQKVLMLVGPQRSGKGTIVSVLTDLVGHINVASTTFAALGESFGLESLLGKRVAVVPDARLSGRTEVCAVVERLLSISGDDAQSVNRKNRRRITTKLKARFVLASNEIPHLPDASGALASRFHILRLPNSFLGKEDTDLKAKLRAELPAILTWAAKGYVRLKRTNAFTQNDAAEQYQRELRDLSSPVKAFAAERCKFGPDLKVRIADLFESWKQWNEARNAPPGIEGRFGRDLHAAYPHIRVVQPRIDGLRVRYYQGVDLRPRLEWGDE